MNDLTPIQAKRFDWNMITTFMIFCQSMNEQTISGVPRIGKSTLFNRLDNLEKATPINIFSKIKGKLTVNSQGLFIGKFFLKLLILEYFASNYSNAFKSDLSSNSSTDLSYENFTNLKWIKIDISLRYYGGKISQSLESAIKSCMDKYPDVLIWPTFNDPVDPSTEWYPSVENLLTIIKGEIKTSNQNNHNKWLVISKRNQSLSTELTTIDLQNCRLVLPFMPWNLVQQAMTFTDKLHLSVEKVNQDYRQLMESSNDPILVNSLLISHSFSHKDWKVSQIQDLPTACIQFDIVHKINDSQSKEISKHFMHEFYQVIDSGKITNWNPKSKLNYWHYFKTIYEKSNITEAATEAAMTQSALSIYLAKFEASLNSKMFNRKSGERLVTKTQEGKFFYKLAVGINNVLENFCDFINSQKLNNYQTLVVGVLPSIDPQSSLLNFLHQNVLKDWWGNHPQVKVEIVEERYQNLVAGLRNHEINFAFIEATSPFVLHIPIQNKEEVGLIVKSDSIASDVESLTWHDLERFKLVLNRKPNGIRAIIDQHCLNLGISLDPYLESDSLNLNQHLIIHEGFAAVLPRSAMSNILKDNLNVKFVSLTPILSRQLQISYSGNRILNQVEIDFLNHLTKIKK